MSEQLEIKNLLEEQKKAWEAFKKVNEQRLAEVEKHGKALAETESKLEKINKELSTLSEQINQRIDKIELSLARPENAGKPQDDEAMKCFMSYIRSGEIKKFANIDPWNATLGGYLLPPEYANTIIEGASQITPAFQLATVINGSGLQLKAPKKTASASASRTNPIGTRSEASGLTFGLETITAHSCYILFKVPDGLLEDVEFDLEGWLRNQMITAIDKQIGQEFISGNGEPSAELEGILTNGDVSEVKTGNASAITADGLLDLIYSLNSAYRRNAVILMNGGTIKQVRKLKDGQNRYLWSPGGGFEKPRQNIDGIPIVESPDMPNIASNAYPIAVGDFKSGYWIYKNNQIRVKRLVELYAGEGCLGLLAELRVGGAVVLPEAIKKQKVAA